MSEKSRAIQMMQRPQGATWKELARSQGWQRHAVRGFVSVLRSKSGLKIRRVTKGERVSYRIRATKRAKTI
jgi:Protein of unknown function (DUF3489)